MARKLVLIPASCDEDMSANAQKRYRYMHVILFIDVNECLHGTHNCDDIATCENTEGSFTSACNDGFIGDGVTCTGTSLVKINGHVLSV